MSSPRKSSLSSKGTPKIEEDPKEPRKFVRKSKGGKEEDSGEIDHNILTISNNNPNESRPIARSGSVDAGQYDETFVLPSSSKTILEGLLSDFDNQSVWDEELKKTEKKKPQSQTTGKSHVIYIYR
jgi:hypothetical protein